MRAKRAKDAAAQALKDAMEILNSGDIARAEAAILAAEAAFESASKDCPSSSSSDSDSDSDDSGSRDLSDSEEEELKLAKAASAVLDPSVGMQQGRCTGFALIKEKGAVLGQTVDLPPSIYGFGDFDVAMRLGWGVGSKCLCYDVDGRLCPIGLNGQGLGVTVFNLHHADTRGYDGPALTVQTIAWELLLGPYTLSSAVAWLKALPCRMMCGSGMMLADPTGSVIVELSHGGISFREAGVGAAALSRSNHPVVTGGFCDVGYQDGDAMRKSSTKRLLTLRRVLDEVGCPVERIEEPDVCTAEVLDKPLKKPLLPPVAAAAASPPAPPGVPDAAWGLKVLTTSRSVCNPTSIATVVCDLTQRELWVEYRERRMVSRKEQRQVIKEMPKVAAKVLTAGLIESRSDEPGSGDEPRMLTGELDKYKVCRCKYVYRLEADAEPHFPLHSTLQTAE